MALRADGGLRLNNSRNKTISAVQAESSTQQENKLMKKENASKLTNKYLDELTESLRQGQTDMLETYLGAMTTFQHSSVKSCSSIAISLMFLRRVYETLNIRLATQPLSEGIRGRLRDGYIVINDRPDESLKFRQLASTLAYELLRRELIADEVVHHPQLLAAKAECVAFVAFNAYGIQTQAIASYSTCLHRKDGELLLVSLERIEKTAARIIESIEADRHAPINIRFSHRSKSRRKVSPHGA